MATYSDSESVHKTLSADTADTVTISQAWDKLRITNRSTGEDSPIWVRQGSGTTIVAEQSGSRFVDSQGGWVEYEYAADGVIQIVGAGQPYSVEGITLD